MKSNLCLFFKINDIFLKFLNYDINNINYNQRIKFRIQIIILTILIIIKIIIFLILIITINLPKFKRTQKPWVWLHYEPIELGEEAKPKSIGSWHGLIGLGSNYWPNSLGPSKTARPRGRGSAPCHSQAMWVWHALPDPS